MAEIRLTSIPPEEVLRYLGAGQHPERAQSLLPLIHRCQEELLAAAQPRAVWREVDCAHTPEGVELPQCGLLLPGKDLAAWLGGCPKAVLLGATLGAGVDALLRRTQLADLSQSLVLESCATVAIEAVCDEAEGTIRAQRPGFFLSQRYSPGYGDLPVTLQGALLRLLDAPRQIGLCATGSSILTPRKSVTAIIGMAAHPHETQKRSCQSCTLKESCGFRRKEEHCGL